MEVLDLPSNVLDQFRNLPDIKMRQQTTFNLWKQVAGVLVTAGVNVDLSRSGSDFRAKTLRQAYYNILRHIRRGIRVHEDRNPEWKAIFDKWSRP